MKLRKKPWLIYLGMAAILVTGVAVSGSKGYGMNSNTSQSAPRETVLTVDAEAVKSVAKPVSLSYDATLEPSEEGIVSSKLNGRVAEIYFSDGQTVALGEPLIKIDDQDTKDNIALAQAQLAAAEAQIKTAENQRAAAETGLVKLQTALETAQRQYDRTQVLYEQGVAAKVDLETAEAALKGAQSDWDAGQVNTEAAQNGVEAAEANAGAAQASLNTLQNALENTVIKAPLPGVIDEKSVSIGQFVSAGAVLAKIKNVSLLNAVVQIEQSHRQDVQEGMTAQIKLKDSDPAAYEGRLESISPGADPASRTFAGKVSVAAGGELRPGVFAKVLLNGSEKREVVEIPLRALSGSDGGYWVFRLENGLAKKLSVSVGELSGDKAEILAGLQAGDKIITTNLSVLQDGDAVKVTEEGE